VRVTLLKERSERPDVMSAMDMHLSPVVTNAGGRRCTGDSAPKYPWTAAGARYGDPRLDPGQSGSGGVCAPHEAGGDAVRGGARGVSEWRS